MNTENTIYELQQLKLRGMLQSYQKILSMPLDNPDDVDPQAAGIKLDYFSVLRACFA